MVPSKQPPGRAKQERGGGNRVGVTVLVEVAVAEDEPDGDADNEGEEVEDREAATEVDTTGLAVPLVDMRAEFEKLGPAVPVNVAVAKKDCETRDVVVKKNSEGDGKALGRKEKDCVAD